PACGLDRSRWRRVGRWRTDPGLSIDRRCIDSQGRSGARGSAMMRSLSVLLLVLIGCADERTDPCIDQAPGTACSWAGLKGQEGYSLEENVRWDLHLSQPQDLLFLPDG